MTTKELTEQQFAIENAEECLEDIETLAWKMPLEALLDYANANDLHLAAVGLDELREAKGVLTSDGPDLLRALIKSVKHRHTP